MQILTIFLGVLSFFFIFLSFFSPLGVLCAPPPLALHPLQKRRDGRNERAKKEFYNIENLAHTNERGKEKSLLFVGFQPFQEGVANDVRDNRNRQLHSQL